MRSIYPLLLLLWTGSALAAQTIGMVEAPAGCDFQEMSDGTGYECRYDNEASNPVHLIFLEQTPTLDPDGARSLSENARRVTDERIEDLVTSFAATYDGLKGQGDPVTDVTKDHFMALYCGEGGGTVRLTATVDFQLRVRECAFAPGPPGMMPQYGVIDTMLYSEFHAAEDPATNAVENARSIFQSLALTLRPVPFEATARDFQTECTNGNFGEMCVRVISEVFEYGEWVAPYWPLQIPQEAWLGCLYRLRQAEPSPWSDDFANLTDNAAVLPAQMVLFDWILRACEYATDPFASDKAHAAAMRWPTPDLPSEHEVVDR